MVKAKFGLRDFEYGVLDDKDKIVGGTKKLSGMESVKMTITNELVTLMADDGPYAVLSGGITGTTLEISNYDLNSETRKDFYGIEVVDGVEKYNKALTPNNIACMFRTSTDDGKAIWVGFLKGKFGLPGMDAETKKGAPDPKADTTTGNFVARGDGEGGDILYIGREDNTDFDLTKFKKMVFPTTA